MLGKTSQSPHDVLYFYYHVNDLEALRSGKWKLELARAYRSLDGRLGGRNGRPAPYLQLKIKQPELYDLDTDPGEHHDVKAENSDVMKKLEADADQMRADLGDNLTHQKGISRREPERIADGSGIYPSDPAFPKAFDDKYRPGLKSGNKTESKSTENKQ